MKKCEDTIDRKTFDNILLRVGTITGIKDIGKEFLLRISVGVIDDEYEIVADLKKGYEIQELIGQQCVIVANAKPTTSKGYPSEAMLLVTVHEGRPVLIKPDEHCVPGVKVSAIQD